MKMSCCCHLLHSTYSLFHYSTSSSIIQISLRAQTRNVLEGHVLRLLLLLEVLGKRVVELLLLLHGAVSAGGRGAPRGAAAAADAVHGRCIYLCLLYLYQASTIQYKGICDSNSFVNQYQI